MSFDHTHYVAVVRWKAAEREALQWLDKDEKSRLTPLIELIPRNFQTKDGEELPIREALQNVAVEIDSSWGSSPAFVDLEHVLNAGIRAKHDDPHILEIPSGRSTPRVAVVSWELKLNSRDTVIPSRGFSGGSCLNYRRR